ncbi:MAG: hypothetical protein AABW87_00710 [Nanoarchaeota archaeon]
MHEALIKTLEEKGPDEMEVAAQAHEEGKEEEKAAGCLNLFS